MPRHRRLEYIYVSYSLRHGAWINTPPLPKDEAISKYELPISILELLTSLDLYSEFIDKVLTLYASVNTRTLELRVQQSYPLDHPLLSLRQSRSEHLRVCWIMVVFCVVYFRRGSSLAAG